MRRLLAATLALAALSGCGGDPRSDYGDSVESHQPELTRTLDTGGPQAIG